MKKLTIVVLILLGSNLLLGQIINIPNDYESIQLGINAANDGDTVLVDTGIYYENINFNGKNIKLLSNFIFSMDTNIIHQTIIDGDSSGSVVSIVNGEDSTLQITGFTIRNGIDTLGGGIKLINSSAKINHCILKENFAYKDGGGIYIYNSNPNITYSSILYNQILSGGRGIGVCIINSTGTITNSKINHNTGGSLIVGGGIFCENSSTVLNYLLISNNFAAVGGGITVSAENGFRITIKNLKVCNNTALLGGGIMTGVPHNNNTSITILNSIFESNHVGNGGQGGGVFCQGKSTFFTNCNFVNNNGGEGGIYAGVGSKVYLTNTILSNNTPSELYIQGQWDITPKGLSYLSFCDVYPNGFSGDESGINEIEGNVFTNPLFMETEEFYYMLSDESPCVNSGSTDTAGLYLPIFDMANNPRIYGNRIDMGAYENQNVWIGIKELPEIKFSIEPNPFRNNTYIRFNSENQKIKSIDLYDIHGSKISTLYTNLYVLKNDKLLLNTNDLEKGAYLIILRTNKLTISKKLIKE